MFPSNIADVEIDEILEKLTTEAAVNLIVGVGPWHTASIGRLGVPAIKVRLLLPPDSYCLTRHRSVMVRMVRGTIYSAAQGLIDLHTNVRTCHLP